ncbi:uncharacterized protein LOC127834904 [Dreissena polymorpha]|uniref:Uncharacterized protein n=1 Tax=Dreissena polymorpha TaxID=45954 RepID=A0A9D4JE28_DREPO|nr:uncharacterized protein LOC127834904 [Dreissena polymorpha]XP_052216996.1 uncharacterized protein LOC127834904 [Dreissena polymorpha]KAH3805233.1 hypothetical protein DPMN_133530 [Dreissena polymorpha]
MEIEITDEPLRNWIKSYFAIDHITSAIRPFMKQLFEDKFQENVRKVKKKSNLMNIYECNSCDPDKVKPYHAMSGQCSFPRKRGRCNCAKENTIPCPAINACGMLYDIMTMEHIMEEPIWSNSNYEQLSTRACEQMKCYISCTGYRDVSNVDQMELTAFFQICTNNTILRRTLDDDDIRMLEQVKNDHREIVGSTDASADKFKKYVSNINVLLDYDTCIVDRDYFISMELKKLEDDKVKITICEEIHYIKKALYAISKAKAELQDESEGDSGDQIRLLETVESMQRRRLQQQTEVFIQELLRAGARYQPG